MRSRERQGDKLGAVEEPIGATTLKIDEASMELLNRARDWRNPWRIPRKRELTILLMAHR